MAPSHLLSKPGRKDVLECDGFEKSLSKVLEGSHPVHVFLPGLVLGVLNFGGSGQCI